MQRLKQNSWTSLTILVVFIVLASFGTVWAQTTDDFNRSTLGTNWAADPEFQIQNNELANTSTTGSWDYVAVNKQEVNPIHLWFEWSSTADATGINEGGFALMMDSASPNANGYLLWRHTSNSYIELYTIVGGSPNQKIGTGVLGSLPVPQAGDRMEVQITSDNDGHHFNVLINGRLDGTITDPNKTMNPGTFFGGVMLKGNLNNNIDNFMASDVIIADNTAPNYVSDLTAGAPTDRSVELTWTATGDDGLIGWASSYDVRYSTSPINNPTDFQNATQALGEPSPSQSGSTENFIVSPLLANTTYYFALTVIDDAGNTSVISNVANETTLASTAQTFTDNFNRTDLGQNWVADPEFQIQTGELTNTATVDDWDYMAVYKGAVNPTRVSYQWGQGANAEGTGYGGFALMLDSASPTANGYLVWRRNGRINMYTIVNGAPDVSKGFTTSALPVTADAGTIIEVQLSSDASGHHFDFYVNGQFDGRISDPAKTQGNAGNLLSGVMLRGGANNNIDNFSLDGDQGGDLNAPAAATIAVGSVSPNAIQITWIAPGDDGNVGTAASYDLRYSTSPINNDSDFSFATQATGLPTPLTAGTAQAHTVSGLATETEYYFALKTIDESGNVSPMSNVVSQTTGTAVIVDDDFERLDLGGSWAADGGFVIDQGELANTATGSSWDHMAVYLPKQNSVEVSYTWGLGADATGINGGGFALMLDAPNPNANGYLVWRHTNNGLVEMYTLVNGVPDSPIDAQAGNLANPVAGDEFKVVMRSDASGHHFDIYINGIFDATVTDANKLQGNAAILYSGVMLRAGLNNNIDNFKSSNVESPDVIAPAAITNLDYGSVTSNSAQLTWSATGDDNAFGTAQSYDIRYSTSPISEANFASATQVANPPTPKASGGSESFFVMSLAPNTLYYFAIKATDESNNTSAISNVISVSTLSSDNIGDDFQRSTLGSDWIAHEDYRIVNGELSNTSDENTWGDHIAIYKPITTPVQVSYTWGQNADANGINEGGFALMMDDTSRTANGYLLFRHTKNSNIDLYTIENGTVGHNVDEAAGSIGTAPKAGDEMKVIMSTDGSGHHFDLYINGQLDGRVSDPGTEQGNLAVLYSGVFLKGALNNNIDNFVPIFEAGDPAILVKTGGDNAIGIGGQPTAQPFEVTVYDDLYHPVPNVDVTFRVVRGDGTLDGDTDVVTASKTNGEGKAMVTLTMGLAEETNQVSASVAGLDSVIFTATAGSGIATNMVLVSGNNQTQSVLQTLTDPFVVKITDAEDTPIEGATVTFTIEQGGGDTPPSLSETSVATDANGEASSTLTFGSQSGTYIVHAASAAPFGSPVVFTANAVADVAQTLEAESVTEQTGTGGVQLPEPFAVIAKDQYDNPKEGVTVTFTITKGDGELAPTQAVTDTNGVASTLFTLSTEADTCIIQASASGLQGSPVMFYAFATGGIVDRIERVSPSEIQGTVNRATPDSFKVQILDDKGIGIRNHNVTFAVTSGSGTFDGASSVQVATNAGGFATALLTSGAQLGQIAVQATATKGGENITNSPVEFKVNVIVPTIAILSGDGQNGTAGLPLANPFVAIVTDKQGEPIAGQNVEFTVLKGGGNLEGGVGTATVTTDEEGKAGITLILGPEAGDENTVQAVAKYGQNPLTGSPLTFKATSSRASKIVKVSGDNRTGTAGQVLGQPFKVKVMNQFDQPINQYPVYFYVRGGGGDFDGANIDTVKTNENGFAQTFYTLGTKPGNKDSVTAEVYHGGFHITDSPMYFITTVADLNKIEGVSGGRQVAEVATTLPNPIKVKVYDILGNTPRGIPVKFTVAEGGGNFYGQQTYTAFTDSNGVAQAEWTIGSQPGTNNNKAYASISQPGVNIEKAQVEMVASGTVGAPSTMVMVSGNGQIGKVGSPLSNPFVVKISDVVGNPRANTQVSFKVIQGGGTLDDTGVGTVTKVSDANGLARVNLTMGVVANDTNKVQVTAMYNGKQLNVDPIIFWAVSRPSEAAAIAALSPFNQSGTAGRMLAQNLKVKVTDKAGNGVKDHTVTFRVTQGGGKLNKIDSLKYVTTDEQGIAEVSYTLGVVAGVQNRIEVSSTNGPDQLSGSPIHFTATGAVGPVDPGVSTIVCVPETLSVDSEIKALITVTLTDTFGNAVYGKSVNVWTSDDTDPVKNPPSPTNENGQAVASLSSTKAGTRTIYARNVNDGFDLTSTGRVVFTPLEPSQLTIESGNGQTGNVGTVLPQKLMAKVADKFGNGILGKAVTFTVTDGGGQILEEQPVLTNAQGVAQVSFVVGPTAGASNVVRASADGLGLSDITFVANSKAADPANLLKVSGDGQTGSAGEPLPEPFVVQVTDLNLAPVWNVPVTFEVAEGTGHIYGQTMKVVRTDYEGKASVQFALGRDIGNNKVLSSSPGLNGSPKTFSAGGAIGKPVRLVYTSGDTQSVAINSEFAQPLVVKITDFYGNGIADQAVIFERLEGEAQFVDNQLQKTDADGFARMKIKAGPTAGQMIVRAKAQNDEEMITKKYEFKDLTSIASVPKSIEIVSGNNQNGTRGRTLAFPFKVQVKDAYSNPVPGVNVNWGAILGGGSFVVGNVTVTDEEGIAENFYQLGPNTGTNSAYAVCESLQGITLTFSANGVDNVFPTFSPVSDKVISEGQTLEFVVNANDEDGDPIVYGARNLPAGAQFDSTGTRLFRWTPTPIQSGKYEVTFISRDNRGGIGADFVDITVNDLNSPPLITSRTPSSSTITISQNESPEMILFKIETSDSDADPVEYFWTQHIYSEVFVVSSADTFAFDPNYNLTGFHEIRANVTDGKDVTTTQWIVDYDLVELSNFAAKSLGRNGIQLNWETSMEINTVGFNVYRSESDDGIFEKINSTLIPSNADLEYAFVDEQVESGVKYFYKLEDVNRAGTQTQHDAISIMLSAPERFHLEQNYPNPFNPQTTILYEVPKQIDVKLTIFNILGQQVHTLVDQNMIAGFHKTVWNGRDSQGRLMPSGIYFYRIEAGDFVKSNRMVLLK